MGLAMGKVDRSRLLFYNGSDQKADAQRRNFLTPASWPFRGDLCVPTEACRGKAARTMSADLLSLRRFSRAKRAR